VIDRSQSQEIKRIDGSFVVGFDKEKKMYVIYNIEEEKFLNWEIED
jgi:hypothetical protein